MKWIATYSLALGQSVKLIFAAYITTPSHMLLHADSGGENKINIAISYFTFGDFVPQGGHLILDAGQIVLVPGDKISNIMIIGRSSRVRSSSVESR